MRKSKFKKKPPIHERKFRDMPQHDEIGHSGAEHRAQPVDNSNQIPAKTEPKNIADVNTDSPKNAASKKTHHKDKKKDIIMDVQTESLNINKKKTIDTNIDANIHGNTKKENAKGTTIEDYSEPWKQFVFDTCSCASCDSYHCFALRYHSGIGCACKKCDHDENCKFYSNLMNNLDIKTTRPPSSREESSDHDTRKVITGRIEENLIMRPKSNESSTSVCSSVESRPCINCRKPLDEYELKKRLDGTLSQSPKYGEQTSKKNQPIAIVLQDQQDHIYDLVREYVRREFHELSHNLRSAVEEIEKANSLQNEQNQPSKSDASTSYSTGFLNMIKSFLGINKESCKTQTNETNTNNETENNIADSVKRTMSEQMKCNDIVEKVERQLMEIEVELSPSINLESSAAKLKAEIMSLPYKEYQQSVSSIKRPIKNKLDLFERIREIYNACSCKVCECVGLAPDQLEPSKVSHKCMCKPCECDDCRRNRLKPKKSTHNKNIQNKCNCKTCNCIKCGDSFATACSCKPCECVDCASKVVPKAPWKQQRYVVATVQERPACVCSPCGCHECDILGMNSRHMHDMGTDDRRHMNCNCDSCNNDNCEQEGADTCICDRHSKLMRKPVVKDTEEYDIRFALDCKKPIHSPLTMFASIPNTLNPTDYRNRLSSEESTQYELQIRKPSSNSSDFWPEHQKVETCPKLAQEPCDCKPCECIKCQKHFLEGHIPHKRNFKNCNCEICDCISSAGLDATYDIQQKYKYLNEVNSRTDICGCKPCDCIDCQRYLCNFQRQVVEPKIDMEYEPASSFKAIDDNDDTKYLSLLKDASDSTDFIDRILTDKESKNCTNYKQESFEPDPFMFVSSVKQSNIVNFSKFHVIRSADWKPSQSIDETVKQNDFKLSDYQDSESTYDLAGGTAVPPDKFKLDQCSINKRKVSYNKSRYNISNGSSAKTVETCIKDVMQLSNFDIPKIKSGKHSNSTPLERILNTENKPSLNFGSNKMKAKKSINWRFDNEYGCGSNLDTEYCKQRKLDISCHCDCSGCSCDHIPCLDLGDKLYIRKHEGTQTADFQENNRNGYTVPILKKNQPRSCMQIQENGHLGEFYPLQKRPDSYHGNTFKTISFNSKQPYLSTDYNSVLKTIQEAKLFSLELLNKLHEYEESNKDFEKYKTNREIHHHDEMLSDQDKDFERNAYSKNFISNSLHKNWIIEDNPIAETNYIDNLIHKTSLAKKKKSALLEILEKHEESNKRIETMAAQFRKMQESAPNSVLDSKVAKVTELNETDKNKKRVPSNHASHNVLENDLTVESVYSRHRGDGLCDVDNKTLSNCNEAPLLKAQQENDLQISEKAGKKSHQKLKQQFINFSKMINVAISRCEKQVWVWANKTNSELQTQETYDSLTSKVTTPCNKNEVNTRDGKIQQPLSNAEKKIMKNTTEQQDQQKHDCICENSEPKKQNQELNICSSEASDTPETKQVPLFKGHKSSQIITAETQPNVLYSARTASSIAMNVKKPDSRKVTIDNITKASRHTILIDWTVPDDLTNVYGYEVMVDGRTVQKLRSPLRNVALISGLPLSNRVLLTVKTLLNEPIAGNRMPFVTCIYNTVKLNSKEISDQQF